MTLNPNNKERSELIREFNPAQRSDYERKKERAQRKADFSGEPNYVVKDGAVQAFMFSTMAFDSLIVEDVVLYTAYPNEE